MQKHLVEPRGKVSKKPRFDPQRIQSFMSKKVKVKNTGRRKTSSNNWLERHINDPFVKQAQSDGFLSRSAYKLMEIDQKYSILKTGQTVIDLGSAPGGWMQIAWQGIRSKNSTLVGLDLLPIKFEQPDDRLFDNVHFVQGDFNDMTVQEQIFRLTNGNIDVILSDMAPNTTGLKDVDHAVIGNLLDQVAVFAAKHLSTGGSMVMKMFEGMGSNDFVRILKRDFELVSSFKPAASRKSSNEVYVVARDFKY